MNAEQVVLVQESFAKVVPIAATAATLFYDRLFEIAPSVRPLFKSDLEKQKMVLIQTLGIVVMGLGQPDKILLVIRSLAERHKDYGVQREHFECVGASLFWALEKGLGDDYTPEVHNAWIAAYAMLSGVMIETIEAT